MRKMSKMRRKDLGWIVLFLAPACIVFLLIYAIPLVMVLTSSLFN